MAIQGALPRPYALRGGIVGRLNCSILNLALYEPKGALYAHHHLRHTLYLLTSLELHGLRRPL
jgi:hypothetical protein